MSSIAYVTDKQMIEYHRLNGNRDINFWKPSVSKKISDFKSGDFLFFLAKGTEKGRKKEKGLLGYGKLVKSYTLSFHQMWTKYETKNGYSSKAALEEAILKITKNHQLPAYLNCFELNEVTFFQAPVYPSEIGLELSNKIESYVYLDKENMMNTSKILEVANDIGIDMWSSLFHKDNESAFIKDAQINVITNIHRKLKTDIYSKYEESRLIKYCQHFIISKHQRMIGKTEWVDIKKDMIIIYLPCLVNTNDFMIKLQYNIGHYLLYKKYIEISEYANEIEPVLLFNQILDDEIKLLLENGNIKYKEMLVND